MDMEIKPALTVVLCIMVVFCTLLYKWTVKRMTR